MAGTGGPPGWWIASDGKWYPPELHPTVRAERAISEPSVVSPGTAFGASPEWPGATTRAPVPYQYGPSRGSFRYALYGSRVIAYVVDAFVTGVAIWMAMVLSLAVTRSTGVGVLLAIAFALWYHVWKLGTSGQTWGMRALKISLADKSTGKHPVGIGRALLRALLAFVITCIPFGIFVDLLWPLWDPDKQTLHDKTASTVVMNDA